MQLLKGPVWAAAIAFLTLADAAPSNLEGEHSSTAPLIPLHLHLDLSD